MVTGMIVKKVKLSNTKNICMKLVVYLFKL